MRTSIAASLLAALGLTLTATVASADDFSPPSWDRNHPQVLTAEWTFDDNGANPTAPDGPLTNVLTKGSGTAPGGSFAQIFGNPAVYNSGDGAWGIAGDGGVHFQLDNIIDQEPVKYLQMQVTWLQVGGLLPYNVSVDPLAAFNTGATGSTPTVPDVTTTIDEGGTNFTLITWEMHPNPPWEQFDLLFTSVTEDSSLFLYQVVVDTISVPEPSTFVTCGIGLLFVSLAARRRHKRA